MTARLLDTFDDEGFENDPLSKAFAKPAGQPTQDLGANPAPSPVPSAPKVPGKYEGKTVDQLIAELENSQSMIGRQSAEVGEARRRADAAEAAAESARQLVDKALKFNQGTGQPTSQAPLSGDTLLAKPQEAIASVVDARLAPLAADIAQDREERRASKFASEHPTFKNDMNDPKFVEWVQGSRTRMKTAAKVFTQGQAPDWDSAEDLWTDYDAERSKGAAPTVSQQPTTPQSNSAPSAPSLVRGGTAPEPSNDGKERFSESALIKMQTERPEEYWSPAVQRRINAGVVVQDAS